MLRQLDLLPKHTDGIGLFHHNVTLRGRAAARLPTPGIAADTPQQVAGAAARITEYRAPEVVAQGRSQGGLSKLGKPLTAKDLSATSG